MKIKEALDKKVDLTQFFTGPFTAIYDAIINLLNIRKKPENRYSTKPLVYDIRHGHPISIKAEHIVSNNILYNNTTRAYSDFTLDTVKMGLKREICDEILRSDLFEWQIEETAMGTRVAARIIVNKFEN